LGNDGRIAGGPDHSRALAAQIADIDPGCPAWIAVDEDPRLLAGIMCHIAGIPHAADDVGHRSARRGAKSARDLIGHSIAGVEHGAVAVIEERQD